MDDHWFSTTRDLTDAMWECSPDCIMWGGHFDYNTISCDWSSDDAGEFGNCPDLKVYSDGRDCDPSCTLTGGTKESKHSQCVWWNVNSV